MGSERYYRCGRERDRLPESRATDPSLDGVVMLHCGGECEADSRVPRPGSPDHIVVVLAVTGAAVRPALSGASGTYFTTMRTAEAADIGVSMDLDGIRSVLREHPVRLAVRFGSRATETEQPAGDIDIAIEFDGVRLAGPGYNETFLGLGADPGETLGRTTSIL